MRAIDARLLRHADIGDPHPIVTADDDQRGQRRDAGGAGGRAGGAARGNETVGGGIIDADDAPLRIVIDQLAVIGRVLVLRLIVGEVGGEALEGRPARLHAPADAVVEIPAALGGQRIDDGRILVLDDGVQLDRDIGDLRKIDMDLPGIAAVIADPRRCAKAEFAGRLAGDDAQGAAFGIAAEKRALRPAQHLDPLNVEQGGVEALRTAEIDAVQIDAHARIPRRLVLIEGDNAADADGERRLARLESRDPKRRDGAVGEIIERLDMAIGDALGIEHAHRDRRILQIGLAPGGGDDHLAEALGGRILRRRGGGGSAGAFGRLGGDGRHVGGGLRMDAGWREGEQRPAEKQLAAKQVVVAHGVELPR